MFPSVISKHLNVTLYEDEGLFVLTKLKNMTHCSRMLRTSWTLKQSLTNAQEVG